MAYTEVETTTYGNRVKKSFGGAKLGVALLLGGIALLWTNEGRTVKTADMLDNAEDDLVEMTDISTINANYENKFPKFKLIMQQ